MFKPQFGTSGGGQNVMETSHYLVISRNKKDLICGVLYSHAVTILRYCQSVICCIFSQSSPGLEELESLRVCVVCLPSMLACRVRTMVAMAWIQVVNGLKSLV